MKTSKSIAEDFLKRKAQEKTEADETVEVEGFVTDIVDKKLAEIEAEKEAEKSKGLEVHTTKPMSDIPPLKEYGVTPVTNPIHDKSPVKKVIEEPVKKVIKEPVERRRLNLMPPFSPFERRGSRIL